MKDAAGVAFRVVSSASSRVSAIARSYTAQLGCGLRCLFQTDRESGSVLVSFASYFFAAPDGHHVQVYFDPR